MARSQALLALAGLLVISGFSTTWAVESDECSLLQVSKGSDMYGQARSGRDAVPPKCLQFMHIPKTGGTSIDAWGMSQNETAFNSLMRETYERMAAKMGPEKFEQEFQSSLGKMYESSHANYPHYQKFFLDHSDSYHLLPQRDMLFCEDLHSPPFQNPGVASWYNEDPDCETFCVVRNPMKKFISAYQMQSIGPCDPKGFEMTLRTFLPSLAAKPSQNFCMFVPQVNYVYGSDSKETSFKQYCKNIIHLEHLDTEFAATMQKFGRPDSPKLPWVFSGKAMDGRCKVDFSTVTQAAKDLIYEHFKPDFEAFGYPRP